MNIHILTETQEKALIKTHCKYTKGDIDDLGIAASAMSSLIQAMLVFHQYKDATTVSDCYTDHDIFNILEMLAEPITDFFLSGAPMAKETAAE